MLDHNTFPQLQVSELCSTHSYNCVGELWYLDTTKHTKTARHVDTKTHLIQLPQYQKMFRFKKKKIA